MRVLAIGATGFIGLPAVSRLVEQGHEVAVLHRGNPAARLPNDARHIAGDRDRLHESRADIESFAPDVVLDVILYTEQQARELISVCRGRTSRIVALSSADVYRNYDGLRGAPTHAPDPVPLAEDAPCRGSRYPYRDADLEFEYATTTRRFSSNRCYSPMPALRRPCFGFPRYTGRQTGSIGFCRTFGR